MWRNWFAPYIIGSERLISASRNTICISHLKELDVDLIERKDRIQIQPAEYNLDMHWQGALIEYSGLHGIHRRPITEMIFTCAKFGQTVLKHAGKG